MNTHDSKAHVYYQAVWDAAVRVVKWLPVTVPLAALVLGIGSCVCHTTYVPYGYCVEARFDSMPPDDKQLAEWLRAQPGVMPHTVAIGRFEPDGKLLYVTFTQSRNLARKPPWPDLNGQASALGYSDSDGRFRDCSDLTRVIDLKE